VAFGAETRGHPAVAVASPRELLTRGKRALRAFVGDIGLVCKRKRWLGVKGLFESVPY
jgi:hypothetical protein